MWGGGLLREVGSVCVCVGCWLCVLGCCPFTSMFSALCVGV